MNWLTLNPSGELSHLINLSVVGFMLFLFVQERYTPVAVAIFGVAAFLLIGTLDHNKLLAVAANPAPPTIAGMFVLSAALLRTGMLALLTNRALALAKVHPSLVIPALLGLTVLLSAFVNNTPVVIMMIPVIISVAQQLKQSASRYLIPLSHAAILGGTCTLIGSSTNILVSGILESQGLKRISMFELTPIGLAFVCAGFLYILLARKRLLKDRPTLAQFSSPQRFLSDVLIHKDSQLVDKKLDEISFFRDHEISVVELIRNHRSQKYRRKDITLQPNDHLILESSVAGVMSLKQIDIGGLSTVDEKEAIVVEALVSPKSPLLSRPLRDVHIQRRYGIYILAIHRHGTNLSRSFSDIHLHTADTILIEGAREDILRLSEDMSLVNLSEPSERPYRRDKAPIAALAMGMVVALAAFNVLPLVTLLAIAIATLLLTKCIETDDAFDAIDWPIIILIYAMLAIGEGLHESGTITWILDGIVPFLQNQSPYLILAILFFLTSIMTEMISNAAVATLMTPFAIGLALKLDMEPRTLALVVMIAASASFASPIGYQTNTLVYNPGGYRFVDFLRFGVPMNVIVGILTIILLPLLWPLF